MFKEDFPCIEKLLKPVNRILTQENSIKKESADKRIQLWNEVRENYDKYIDGDCKKFYGNFDNIYHSKFNAALIILAISFRDNGESFAPAEKFSNNECEAYKKITQYNVFESRTPDGIRKKIEHQNDETLVHWYDDYQGMKKWVDTSLKDPGMDEHVRYYLNEKWGKYCHDIDKALHQDHDRWIHRVMGYKDKQKTSDVESKKWKDTDNLFTLLQEKAKKLTWYVPLTNRSFADARDQITTGRYDDARKTLIAVEIAIDTLLECEALLAVWRAKGYTLTEFEGLHPRNADEVHLAFQKNEQNINRLETITQELELKKRSFPNLREHQETASIILSIEQNLKNPARIDTVERDYQQLNNAISQQKIIEQNLRDQLEKVRREVRSSEIKQEIDLIEKSIQQRGIPNAKEMFMSLAEKQLSKVTAFLSKFRPDGAVVSSSTDPIRKQIKAQNYGDAIIDSEKVIAEWNSIEGSRFVKVADAKHYERNFIGRTGREVGGREVGKVKNQIKIGGRIFIVEEIADGSQCSIDEYISHITRQLTPNEKLNLPENRHLTAKLVEKKFLDLGVKERYTFRALFLSRPEKYAKFGFDTKPLSMTDINPVLDDVLKEAKQIGETVFLCIASPTGFEPDIHTFMDSDDFHKNFLSRYLSVCFLDLETAKTIINPADEVGKSFLPYCKMELDKEKMEKIRRCLYQAIDYQFQIEDYAEYNKALLRCKEAVPSNDVDAKSYAKSAFYQYGDEKGLKVRYIEGVGLVMRR